MSKGRIKQILLLTDGCSNEGTDPIAVASAAKEYGITINVIGLLDEDILGEKGMEEVKNIAAAGGGVHQVVSSAALPKTVQMVTKKAMTQTIHQVVNKELQHILGAEQEVEKLPPEKRGQVVEVVENLGETMTLDLLILVDTSASMNNKIPSVKQALRDLSLSLQSRIGENRFSLWTYPGHKTGFADKQMDWSDQFNSLGQAFSSLAARGTTPTGPALEEVLHYFIGEKPNVNEENVNDEDEGMLRDYVF